MTKNYINPSYRASSFNCPHCNVLAKMTWYDLSGLSVTKGGGLSGRSMSSIHDLIACHCYHCKRCSFWLNNDDTEDVDSIMVFPNEKFGEPAHIDMPDDVKNDYEEARLIFNNSPRGAAALLRLALQKLMVHLGEDGKKIQSNIVSLIDKDLLPQSILKILDATRIVGNESVHPGRMLEADRDNVAAQLFKLINLVIERAISDPKLIEDLYSKTPETKRNL